MAIPVKAILLEPHHTLGSGLRSIREMESQAIDVSEFADCDSLSDATVQGGSSGYIIHDNKVYRMIKTYLDTDKKIRWIIAKNEDKEFDILPVTKA